MHGGLLGRGIVALFPREDRTHLLVSEAQLREHLHNFGFAVCECGGNAGHDPRSRVWRFADFIAFRVPIALMNLVVVRAEIDGHHLELAEQGRRCPVVAKPGLFVGIGGRDGARERLAGTVVEDLDTVACQVEGLLETVIHDPAAPTFRTVVEAAADQFRVGKNTLDCLQFRVLLGQIFRDQPVLSAAIGQDVGDGPYFSFGFQLLIDRRGVDPHLGCDVGLAVFCEGCRRGDRVGRHHGHLAAIALLHDEFCDIRHDRGGCPVHLGDRDLAAIRVGIGRAGADGESHRRYEGRCFQ